MAESPTGDLWIAADNDLVKVEPKTGRVITMALPTMSSNSTAASYGPPTVRGTHHVVGIAADRTTVVVVSTGTAEAVSYGISSKRFNKIAIPGNSSPTSVAVSGTVVAIGLVTWTGPSPGDSAGTGSANAVDIVGHTHQPHLIAGNAAALSAVPGGFAMVAATENSLSKVAVSQSSAGSNLSVSVTVLPLSSGTTRPTGTAPLLTAGPTDVIAMTSSGFIKVNLTSGKIVATVVLPVMKTGEPLSIPASAGEPPASRPSTFTEQQRPLFATIDGSRDVWFEANGVHAIYRVPKSAF
jgi:hypothetical protein